MTSNNLFFKRMKQDLGQRVWIPVLLFIVGILCRELTLVSELNYLWCGVLSGAHRSSCDNLCRHLCCKRYFRIYDI